MTNTHMELQEETGTGKLRRTNNRYRLCARHGSPEGEYEEIECLEVRHYAIRCLSLLSQATFAFSVIARRLHHVPVAFLQSWPVGSSLSSPRYRWAPFGEANEAASEMTKRPRTSTSRRTAHSGRRGGMRRARRGDGEAVGV